MLATYAFLLSGVSATHQGSVPTGTSSSFWFASPSALSTGTELLSGFTRHASLWSLVMAIGLELVGAAVACAVASRSARPVSEPATAHHPTATPAPTAHTHAQL